MNTPDPSLAKIARVRYDLDLIIACEPPDYLGSEEAAEAHIEHLYIALREARARLDSQNETNVNAVRAGSSIVG